MDGYRYMSSDPNLYIIMKNSSILIFGFGLHRSEAGLQRIGSHKVEIRGFEVHIFVLVF